MNLDELTSTQKLLLEQLAEAKLLYGSSSPCLSSFEEQTVIGALKGIQDLIKDIADNPEVAS